MFDKMTEVFLTHRCSSITKRKKIEIIYRDIRKSWGIYWNDIVLDNIEFCPFCGVKLE